MVKIPLFFILTYTCEISFLIIININKVEKEFYYSFLFPEFVHSFSIYLGVFF